MVGVGESVGTARKVALRVGEAWSVEAKTVLGAGAGARSAMRDGGVGVERAGKVGAFAAAAGRGMVEAVMGEEGGRSGESDWWRRDFVEG